MVKKTRVFFTIEKEEAWLNKQLQQGKRLVGPVGDGLYYFIDQPSYSKIIRIDVRKFKTKNEEEEYVQFMEDAGWQRINSRRSNNKQYFFGDREGNNELFSDYQSKYEREIRARNSLLGVNFLLIILYGSIFYDHANWQFFFHPKSAFFTPGLWNEQGGHFLMRFLFELPFAIGRIGLNLIPFILLLYFVYHLIVVQRSINSYKKKI